MKESLFKYCEKDGSLAVLCSEGLCDWTKTKYICKLLDIRRQGVSMNIICIRPSTTFVKFVIVLK